MKNCFLVILACLIIIHIRGNAQSNTQSSLDTVIVNANKLNQTRKEVPIAISVINNASIKKENTTRLDFLLNKISGVYMPSIGNEQHMMSIRQPISLKGLYLYLEDGMPIRTSGLFSNNALIEINTAFNDRIEIIKGPASSLYGAEAIGGVIHFFTKKSTPYQGLEMGTQINNLGYKKIESTFHHPTKKGGWLMNINLNTQKNGPIEYSDYSKKAISLRHDFTLNKKWNGFQTLQYINYYAQMTGSVDSIHFTDHNFKSLQSFTFRALNVIRLRQNLEYHWNSNIQSTVNLLYRDNIMDQNPTYAIASTNNPIKFKGQTNSNQFRSLVLDLQQIFNMPSLHSKIIIGSSFDNTNQNLKAKYIDILKDTIIGKYTKFTYPINDSLLTNYNTAIQNAAVYVNLISNWGKHINLNASIRYDAFEYLFHNQLSFGTPSSNNHFSQFTPKIGISYHKNSWGSYLNYSNGFVPPQITEIYNAIKVPYLLPQYFNNMEVGFWLKTNKMEAELNIYQMKGEHEIISVRQPDGVNLNQNAGSTLHIGIEYQIRYKLIDNFSLLLNGTNAKHSYISTIIKGIDVSGKNMNAAPSFWGTVSGEWNPVKNIVVIADWQHQSSYYMDEINTTSYPGFDVLNFKINLVHKHFSYWIHLLNATNTYYSTMATKNFSIKGNAAYSYYIGEPRSISIGCKWSLFRTKSYD